MLQCTSMIVLGIDPGNARLGWAIVEGGRTPVTRGYGCIETPASRSKGDRLVILYDRLRTVLDTHKPDAMAIEELFFATNAKTVISVAEARGVALLVAAQKHIPIASYTPLQVKLAVTGNGRAEKYQMQRMVATLLKLPGIPTPDDAADALAIALTHSYMAKTRV